MSETRIYSRLVGTTAETARLMPVRFINVGESGQTVEVMDGGTWRKMAETEHLIQRPRLPQIETEWVA